MSKKFSQSKSRLENQYFDLALVAESTTTIKARKNLAVDRVGKYGGCSICMILILAKKKTAEQKISRISSDTSRRNLFTKLKGRLRSLQYEASFTVVPFFKGSKTARITFFTDRKHFLYPRVSVFPVDGLSFRLSLVVANTFLAHLKHF